MLVLAVCTNNNYNYLFNCLDSVKRQSNQNFNLIIQDNSPKESKDQEHLIDLVGKIDNFYFNDFKANGLSQSRNICSNLAVEIFNSEFIHYIDDDVLLPNDFIDNLHHSISSLVDPKAIGSKILPHWGSVSKPNWFTDQLYPLLSILDFGDRIKQYGGENGVWWLGGANICFHIDTLHELGGFNVQLGRNSNNQGLMGSEENEILSKMKDVGLVVYDPSFPVFHTIREERLNKQWMIKRCVWQSVCDVLTDSKWQDSISDPETRIREAAESIIMHGEKVDFCNFLSKVQYLSFKLLKGELD